MKNVNAPIGVAAYQLRNMLIHPVTARFGDGKITGIIGRNGSGKTVLFKMICGLGLPDRGEIIVNGERLNDYFSLDEIIISSGENRKTVIE